MSTQPLLLDLFCGAGGCAVGYRRAGFDVVGVDIKPQPRYPFAFCEGDAIELLRCLLNGGYFRTTQSDHTLYLSDFDAIHASPPCQTYSRICRGMGTASDHPDLVDDVRNLLEKSDVPWIIENVEVSPLRFPVTLCGTMFGLRSKSGLWLRRHRGFELSWAMLVPTCQHPRSPSIGVYGNGTNKHHRTRLGRNITTEEQREAMGIDWMPRSSLTQAIPPAYTEFIGRQLIKRL